MGSLRAGDYDTVPGTTSTNPLGSVTMQPRTAALSRKVAAAKGLTLSVTEWATSVGLGTLFTLPFAGLTGFATIPTNTTTAIFRYGKLTRVVNKPGLVWIAPNYTRVDAFTGTQTHKMDELHLVDASGNPIIIRAMMEYAVVDPAALFIATDNNKGVLFNQAEQVVREACTKLPLLGEKGHDIRSQTHEIGAGMLADLQPDATVCGIDVQRLCIVEARYAPEIASSMLMKQQAQAMVAARKEIVAGALGIVRDVLGEFPNVSDATREKIITNMLVTLTSHTPAAPVIPLAG